MFDIILFNKNVLNKNSFQSFFMEELIFFALKQIPIYGNDNKYILKKYIFN